MDCVTVIAVDAECLLVKGVGTAFVGPLEYCKTPKAAYCSNAYALGLATVTGGRPVGGFSTYGGVVTTLWNPWFDVALSNG